MRIKVIIMARKNKEIKENNAFYIITNGAETEYNYFTLLKSRKSIYDVKVLFANKDPLGLVEYASNYLSHANQVWCVFDIDYTHRDGKLIPALNKAKKIGVKIAFSNIAFEVWLISHFKVCNKPLQIGDYQNELDNCLKDEKYKGNYSKNNQGMLSEYFIPRYAKAVENARVVHQRFLRDHGKQYDENSNPKIWEWNSCTTVYKLIEALKLSK